jgi:hypothetical protein
VQGFSTRGLEVSCKCFGMVWCCMCRAYVIQAKHSMWASDCRTLAGACSWRYEADALAYPPV